MLFKDFIQAIGKGQRSGRTLTREESYQAMSMLLAGEATPEQRGAFLMLLRVREETAQEIAGFLDACREHTVSSFANIKVDLDLGCYAGKRRHLPWVILSALCLAQQGCRIVFHGSQEPDTKRLYVSEALEKLGCVRATTAQQLNRQIDTLGFGCVDLATVNPELDSLIQLRAQFGLRSCANTLARMLNPLNASASLQGVYHKHLDEKHGKVAQILKEPRVICFRGDAGEVEYNPERTCMLHSVCAGEYTTSEIPALNHQWVTKPRALDVGLLKQLWLAPSQQYPETHPLEYYGQSAVIGTLALMLMVTQQLDWVSGYKEARSLWLGRKKQWPSFTY